jgi:hypothetical protein
MGTLTGCKGQIRYSLKAVINAFDPEISIAVTFNGSINRVMKQTGNVHVR